MSSTRSGTVAQPSPSANEAASSGQSFTESPKQPGIPSRHLLGLACAFFGMGLLLNVSRFLLVFFYLPPDDAGLPQLVNDTTFLGVLNVVVLVVAAGRLFDAITDPIIAVWSDRSRRRLPMMTTAVTFAAVFTALLFFTPSPNPGAGNVLWLIGVQAALFLATTAYMTPMFALIRDLSTKAERVKVSTVTGAAWSIGLIGAAMTPVISQAFESGDISALSSWRWAVAVMCVVSAVFMSAPQFLINEPDRRRSDLTVTQAIGILRSSPHFRPYLAADAAYWCGLMVIQTGLLYYVTVLLGFDRSVVGLLIVLMVVMSLPIMGVLPKATAALGKRTLYFVAFGVSIVAFGLIPALGHLPGPTWSQAVLIMALLAVPVAIIGGLSNGLLADIAEVSEKLVGTDATAMFFAGRTFVQKVSQTIGLVFFAILTTLGRDPGDDLGIRLSGLVAIAMYLVAIVAFRRFDEADLNTKLGTE